MNPEGNRDTAPGEAPVATARISAVREPGTVLGSYRLLDVLGEGGMGVVYLAEHIKLGRKVGIKTLRTEYAHNPQAVKRFFAEARAVNRIEHEHIVEITDFVEQPGGDNYIIMELLVGTTLGGVCETEPVPELPRSIGIMVQVASALEAVHDAGIIHRDLKPDNVFLIERGGQKDFVKLLDFGVAKLLELGDELSMQRTAAGAILGTPEFMSPEQAGGKAIDHRTDIYSFGVILYELVTGKLPFEAKTFGELVVKHLTVTATPPRRVKNLPHEIPSELNDLILACLAKDPESRPDSMGEIAQRLLAIAEAQSWKLATYSGIPRFDGTGSLKPLRKPKPDPRTRRLVAGIAAGAVALVVAIALVLASGPDTATPAAMPAPAPAPPATIEITFESSPDGAQVFRAGETVPLGTTPLTQTFTPSERLQRFEIRKDGYQPAAPELVLDRGRRVRVSLDAVEPVAEPVAEPVVEPPPAPVAEPVAKKKPPRKKTAKPPRDPKAKKPVDRTGVLNPFD